MNEAHFQSLMDRIQSAQDKANALRRSGRAQSTQSEVRSSRTPDTSQSATSAPPAFEMFQPPSSNSIRHGSARVEITDTVSPDAVFAQSERAQTVGYPTRVDLTPRLEDTHELLSSFTSASWGILYDKFCKFYCNDLPFLCPSTIVGPPRTLDTSNGPTCSVRDSKPLRGSDLLRLCMVALTIRHCKGDWRYVITGHDQDLRTSEQISAHSASLAMLLLSELHRHSHDTTLEEVQGKLFLSSYHWSICQWSKARRLLNDAMLGMYQLRMLSEDSIKAKGETMSAAMVFEARLMGLDMQVPDREKFISGNTVMGCTRVKKDEERLKCIVSPQSMKCSKCVRKGSPHYDVSLSNLQWMKLCDARDALRCDIEKVEEEEIEIMQK
ncbi:hypothetical protein Q7P35_009048 [Cladosporium inversicolor]